MSFLKVKNRAYSTLASGVSDSDTSWTVATGEGSKFPTTGDFHVTCEDEIVKCTSRSGDVLTVTRAQEGTAAAAHVAGKAVELRITAGIIEALENEIIRQSLLTTRGDIIYRGASVAERLAAGVVGGALLQGTDDPAWSSPPLVSIASKTYYIDSVDGDDGNSGEASDDAFETWAKIESMVPIFVLHPYTLRIIGDMPEDVDIRGRIISGSATLLIRGNTTTPGDHEVNRITLKALIGDFRVQYLQATNLISVMACLPTSALSMYELEPRCPAATEDWAITIKGGLAYFYNCDFGTDVVKDCIYVDAGYMASRNNSGNGTRYGLAARGGGVIGKKDTQPTGSTANEYATDGGVIR